MPAAFTYDEYRLMLQTALDNGYTFIAYPQLADYRNSGRAFCLLRHDCDNDLTASVLTAQVEAELGIQSTYFLMTRSAMYNLFSPPSVKQIHTI